MSAVSPPEPPVSPLRYADARGARLAYQVIGDGPHTIISIPPLAQNIEMAWEWPDIRRMLQRFGAFSTFIHFDKRGTGCSDRRTQVNGIDERVDDLRALMDSAGVDRAHFYANSEGGPMAILFAVTYPHRVLSLTLHGTGASIAPPDMSDADRAAWRLLKDDFVRNWGTEESIVARRHAPSLGVDPAFREWHQRYERNSASTHSLDELLELTLEMDTRDVLEDITVPTLVLHRKDDAVVPVAYARELAERIPGARLFVQEGVDHFSYAGDVDGWMDEMERFITGTVTSPPTSTIRPSVRIMTLGRFAVERDGIEVETAEWGSRLARQLCKRLVAGRGWPVTRDELMEMLWPSETDRQRAAARLSVQLSTVRRILGGGVVATRESVRLDLDEVKTDLESFYAASGDEEIVAAYHGDFLPEDVYDDWTDPTRIAVRTRFVAAARRLAQRLTAQGDHLAAVECARRIIAVDNYDGDAHRLVTEGLQRAGETGQARVAHAAWREAMAELGFDVPAFPA